MNERIQELAEQAASDFTQNFNWEYLLQIDKDIFEKFAELIVRECIETIADCSVEYCTRPQIVSEIKQHFGVRQ